MGSAWASIAQAIDAQDHRLARLPARRRVAAKLAGMIWDQGLDPAGRMRQLMAIHAYAPGLADVLAEVLRLVRHYPGTGPAGRPGSAAARDTRR